MPLCSKSFCIKILTEEKAEHLYVRWAIGSNLVLLKNRITRGGAKKHTGWDGEMSKRGRGPRNAQEEGEWNGETYNDGCGRELYNFDALTHRQTHRRMFIFRFWPSKRQQLNIQNAQQQH